MKSAEIVSKIKTILAGKYNIDIPYEEDSSREIWAYLDNNPWLYIMLLKDIESEFKIVFDINIFDRYHIPTFESLLTIIKEKLNM